MPTPETLTPERAEQLVAGDVPETSREALVAGLVRELRSGAAEPPETLRERVAELRPPAARRPRRRRARIALVLAVLALAAVAAVALAPGEDAARRSADPSLMEPASEDDLRPPAPEADDGEAGLNAVPSRGEARADYDAAKGEPAETPGGFGADEDFARARDVKLELELRVADADAVSEAANGTMRAVRELGGHVVASELSAEGEEGSAQLRVAVPTRRLEDAVVAISALGTVTAQQVEVEDLQRSVDRRSNRVEALERAIRRDEIRLASGALSPEERLRVELRLDGLRGQLRSAKRERAELLREAAFAELTVSLHTREAPQGAAAPEGRIEGAARDGLAALAVAASAAVFLLVLGGPLLALAALVWVVRRRRVRRADEALLDRPGPAAS